MSNKKVELESGYVNVPAFVEVIQGSGGGGGKGGGRAPKEAKDTFRSTAIARILLAYSAGETEGLLDGASSIYFDGTPLADPLTGALNFKGVRWEERFGLASQPRITGFDETTFVRTIGTEVSVDNGAVIRTVTDANIDAVRVLITVPVLQDINQSTGDINGTSVVLNFAVRDPGIGVWVDRGNQTINGKSSGPFQVAYRIESPENPSGAWDIRVTRITADSTRASLQNTTVFDTMVEIREQTNTYPGVAYVGIEVDTQLFGNRIPTVSLGVSGVKVKVPVNYDETNGIPSYSGVWNGTFKFASTSNPAWHIYNLLINSKYGAEVPEGFLDKYSFYTIAQYCDAVDPNTGTFVGIDDGNDGVRRRFTINTQIAGAEDALTLLQNIAASMRGILYYGAGSVVPSQDRPKSISAIITNENVLDGKFIYASTEAKDRITVANITYNNRENFFAPTVATYPPVETWDDDSMIERYGKNIYNGAKFGCDNEAEAYAFAKWIVYSSTQETDTCQFNVGPEHSTLRPGDVIEIYDRRFAKRRMGGRIAGGTTTTVILDNPVTLTTGETYSITLVDTDGKTLLTRNITNAPGTYTTVTLNSALPSAPTKNYTWAIKGSDIEPRQFRIVNIEKRSLLEYEVFCMQHNPDKYDLVEEDISLIGYGGGRGFLKLNPPSRVRWTGGNNPTKQFSWRSIAYNGSNLWVAVADNGSTTQVMTSPDGITWTIRNTPANLQWRDVVYGDGTWVAVAASGTGSRVMTSTDGINWTLRTTPADNTWTGVTYGAGTFVAVASTGTNNRVMTSNDGITWTLRTVPRVQSWYKVTYAAGLFVAVSFDGTVNQRVMTSPNGITWTMRTTPVTTYRSGGNDITVAPQWSDITYGSGQFVAVATSGRNGQMIMTSPNGTTWTMRSALVNATTSISGILASTIINTPYNTDSGPFPAWRGVAFGGGVYVAVASTGNSVRIIRSTNGITWTSVTTNLVLDWQSVRYGGGLFVAVANNGGNQRVYTSPDGLTWTARTSASSTNSWESIAYGNNTWVAVSDTGDDSRAMTSVNGQDWTFRTSPLQNWRSVAYGNGLFVAVASSGTGNRVMTSPDGITWTSRTTPTDLEWRSVAYGNGLFVAVSESGTGNRVMTSPNGITWTSRTSAANNNWQSVTYGNGVFVAVANTGSGNRVMTSTDGITWTARTVPDRTWRSVAYGNGLFVAVSESGTGNRVMTSPDGVTWTTRTSAADYNWQSVAFGNGVFVAVANTGTGERVMTSGDGANWILRDTPSDSDWSTVGWGNGTFVALSRDLSINGLMTSYGPVGFNLRTRNDPTRGVFNILNLVWEESDSESANRYRVRYRRNEEDWIEMGIFTLPTADILDVLPGVYDVEIYTRNSGEIESVPVTASYTVDYNIPGILFAPIINNVI